MHIEHHLLKLGEIWCVRADRAMSTLGIKIANDGKFFDRVRRGAVSVDTFGMAMAFFKEGANWPDGVIPDAAVSILDLFENIACEAACATGQIGDLSRPDDAGCAEPGVAA